jgi:mRNA deadenylase 3'-5' endonuclease subunit Ccr4
VKIVERRNSRRVNLRRVVLVVEGTRRSAKERVNEFECYFFADKFCEILRYIFWLRFSSLLSNSRLKSEYISVLIAFRNLNPPSQNRGGDVKLAKHYN